MWQFDNRHHYSSRHFIIPVTVYTLLYNLPKFMEFTTVCVGDIPFGNYTAFNETEYSSLILHSQDSCRLEELRIVATSIRSETQPFVHKYRMQINPFAVHLNSKLSFLSLLWGRGHWGHDAHIIINFAIQLYIFRTNYWYVNVYVLGLNTLFNIVLPILSLIILNVIILR